MRRDRSVQGWVIYDLANVIFALGVAGLYYPLWIVDDLGGKDRHVAIASSASMFVIFGLAPLLGMYADKVGKRVAPLAVCTVICCVLTALIGQGGLYESMAIFAIANLAFGCGLVFYDALLPTVSTPETRGRISGYGVGAGFGGAIIAVVAGIVILAVNASYKPVVFEVLAVLFLLGSIPCFLWVRDQPRQSQASQRPVISIAGAIRRSREVPGMSRFLLGRIFYTDAANTLFAFMSVYAVKEVGFSDLQTQLVLLVGILVGPVGAIGSGKMVDRIGAKPTLDRLLVLWMVVLALCAAIPGLGLPSALFWGVAPLGGLAFGGTGTVDRALLLEISPPNETGTFFGLFAMVGRFSSILGPLLWALIADVLGFGRPLAVAALFVMASISWWMFRSLPEWLSTGRPGDLARESAAPAAIPVP